MQRSVIWGMDKPTVVVFHRLGFYNEKEQKECADLIAVSVIRESNHQGGGCEYFMENMAL